MSDTVANMSFLPGHILQFSGVGLALALGLLIGVQRNWASRDAAPGSRFAGIRTYGLLGLAGGLAGGFYGDAREPALILLAAAATLVVIGYWRGTRHDGPISGTASLAGLLTLACGFLAASGQGVQATVATGLIVLVLAMRTRLHHWVEALDEAEVAAIGRFAGIALVILPLLPDTPFGPYGAWRLRQLWLVVVMVSGFSFAGYLAAKRLGATRGVLAIAAAGSMVSSTAITASLAGKLRDNEGDAAVLNAGIALASAVMFFRVMVLTAALALMALPTFAIFAIPGLLVSLLATALLLRGTKPGGSVRAPAMVVRNPFDLGPALLLMVLVMALTVAARWVLARYGNSGVATVLALSGVADVDSAIITLGNLPVGTLSPRTAGLVLAAPIVLNTLFKASIAISIAGWRRAWRGAVVLIASAAAVMVPVAWLLI